MFKFRSALIAAILWVGSNLTCQATTTVYEITTSIAAAENACPESVLALKEDCSYNAINSLNSVTPDLPVWVGPVFSAGYFAPTTGPQIFTNPVPPSPVTSPSPILPLTEIPIPVTGLIGINDNDTSATCADDIVYGAFTLGAFDRNVDIGNNQRVVETFASITHLLPVGTTVHQGQTNANGGCDYVISTLNLTPPPLEHLTNGTPSDYFPSTTASQASGSAQDISYWSAPSTVGLATFETNANNPANIGISTTAVVNGYTCIAAQGACPSANTTWDTSAHASFSNVLLRMSTGLGADGITLQIQNIAAFLDNEYASTTGGTVDSWTGTVLSAINSSSNELAATPLVGSAAPDALPGTPVDIPVLSDDTPTISSLPVVITVPPTNGAATVASDNTITYTPTYVQGQGYGGTDLFFYGLQDPSGNVSTATFVLFTSPSQVYWDTYDQFLNGIPINVITPSAALGFYASVLIEVASGAANPKCSKVPENPTVTCIATEHGTVEYFTQACGPGQPDECKLYYFPEFVSTVDNHGVTQFATQSDSFQYMVSVNGHPSPVVPVTVTPRIVTYNTTENTPVTVQIPTGTCPSGPVTITSDSAKKAGLVRIDSASSSVLYTPPAGYAGEIGSAAPPAGFEYTVTVGGTACFTADAVVNTFPSSTTNTGGSQLDPVELSLLTLAGLRAWSRRRRIAAA